jgi:signal transduction histidine kinase
MANGEFYFIPSARLQKYLGSELIADPNLAIAEFVKNAYDAGADEVHVEFRLADRSSSEQLLVISDNGVGMDEEAFGTNWMRPGYSAKAEPKRLDSLYKNAAPAARARAKARVPTGEKGLGRLAAARLGRVLDVYTRQTRNQSWLHVHLDWKRFEESMDERLDAIPIEYDYAPPDDPPFSHGTIMRVSELTLNWTGRIPGRKVPGRPDTRLARLRQDLGILLQPDAIGPEAFRILLQSDDSQFDAIHGEVASTLVEEADYSYDFEFLQGPTGPCVKRHVHRSELLAKRLGRQQDSEESLLLAKLSSDLQAGQLEARPESLRSGPFSGRFWYFPSFERRYSALKGVPGIFLYRDGVRVDPYGHEDDDWLGAKARKAARQGYAAIQPKLLAGQVLITKTNNPKLIDMSNRQGLVENPAFEDFIAQTRAEFQHFERLVFDEYLTHEWTSQEVKAQRAAHDQLLLYTGLLRSLVHSLRQPVAGLGLDMRTIRNRVNALPVEDVVKQSLLEVVDRAQQHVGTIDDVINRFFELNTEPVLSWVSIARLIDAAVDEVRPLTESAGVQVVALQSVKADIYTHPESVVEVLAELVRNAVEAMADSQVGSRVDVSASIDQQGGTTFRVEDDGPGVASDVADGLFQSNVSTKGRPGSGLLQAALIVRALRGSVDYVPNSQRTRFEVTLPPLESQ